MGQASTIALAGAGALIALAALAPPGRAAAPARLSEDMAPAALYAAAGCAQCHGYAGQGGNAGPRLADMPYTSDMFAEQLRHPADEMPPYTAKVLSDAQVTALHAYVRAFR